MSQQRLSKFLASAGVASRRKSEELIFSGRVSVNGQVSIKPQIKVSEKDVIRLNDERIYLPESKKYFLFHKPKGCVCTFDSKQPKGTIYQYLPSKPRLFSVGRLDRDTSGLLLITNDGDFAQKVIHPSSDISKEYLVKVTKELEDSDLKKLSAGMRIEGKWIKPAKVIKVRKGTFKISVKEGKKHEIRLLVEHAHLTLIDLKRIRIGGVLLGNILEGTFRSLTEKEKLAIFS